MVPVPIIDLNKQAHSYIHLQIERPYIALNSEAYISLRNQELRTCKNIGYEFYCEELFVVKHKSKYSCESVIYFNLGSEIIFFWNLWLYVIIQNLKLVMYLTENTAFINYLDNLTNSLKFPLLLNQTKHEQTLPIYLQSFDFNPDVLKSPKMLKEFVHQFQHKKEIFNLQKRHSNDLDLAKKNSLFG